MKLDHKVAPISVGFWRNRHQKAVPGPPPWNGCAVGWVFSDEWDSSVWLKGEGLTYQARGPEQQEGVCRAPRCQAQGAGRVWGSHGDGL